MGSTQARIQWRVSHWSKKHCQAYVNKFAFRLNEGNCERDIQDRLDDLFRAMVGKTITYKELTS